MQQHIHRLKPIHILEAMQVGKSRRDLRLIILEIVCRDLCLGQIESIPHGGTKAAYACIVAGKVPTLAINEGLRLDVIDYAAPDMEVAAPVPLQAMYCLNIQQLILSNVEFDSNTKTCRCGLHINITYTS